MIDIIRRLSVGLISGSIALYMSRLIIQGQVIVYDQIASYNYLIFGFLLFIILFVIIVYSFLLFSIKMPKITFLILGILVIHIGYTYLFNDVAMGVYLSDIMRLYGVFLILFGSTGVLITDTQKKIEATKDLEIIEV